MNTFVPVLCVVVLKGRQDSQLDPRRITVFLDRPDDFDSTTSPLFSVISFDYFAECPLTKESGDFICNAKLSDQSFLL